MNLHIILARLFDNYEMLVNCMCTHIAMLVGQISATCFSSTDK